MSNLLVGWVAKETEEGESVEQCTLDIVRTSCIDDGLFNNFTFLNFLVCGSWLLPSQNYIDSFRCKIIQISSYINCNITH